MPLILALQSPPPIPDGVVIAVNQFTDFLLRYLGALAAVGALSMALIEAAKKLLDSRTKFQALRWTRWVMRTPLDRTITGEQAATHSSAMAQLIQLCTGVTDEEASLAAANLIASEGHLGLGHAFHTVPAHALFALELPRMMGSIQDAADVALASPPEYPDLYQLMTVGAKADDVERWYRDGSFALVSVADLNPTPEQRQAVKEHAERFARLRQIVKRKLDGFQLYTGDRWGSWNQAAANAVGMVAMFIVLTWVQRNGIGASISFPTLIVFSLLGGILSPVAKDLVSALKRVKDG
ncbi:MAG: hypothetical protein H0W63_00715 [Gemmatimonadaceae bacterium]|nr:hypothetical protein [Gemmatimonadaceae bacterium]